MNSAYSRIFGSMPATMCWNAINPFSSAAAAAAAAVAAQATMSPVGESPLPNSGVVGNIITTNGGAATSAMKEEFAGKIIPKIEYNGE